MKQAACVKTSFFGRGETRAHVQRVFHCERVWRTFKDGKAKDGFGWRTH
jgi:hypothetical protein